MNVLMFGMSNFPGGVENYLINYFANTNLPSDFHIDYAAPGGVVAFQELITKRGDSILHLEEPKRNPLKYIISLVKIISKKKYDVAYINMLSAANVLPVVISKLLGIPRVIVHSHASGTVKGALRRFLHMLNRKICTLVADQRLACSVQAGQWIFGAKDFTVIPNAICSDKFAFSENNRNEIRTVYSIPRDSFVIGHVGRLAEEKNHLFLLKLLSELVKWNTNIRMFFVGDGPEKNKIDRYAQEKGLKEYLIIAGATDETFKFYSAFDCFAFPSVFEGFGMAALEAQASGLKCFCSRALPSAVNVNGDVEFISINEGIEEWLNKIKAYVNDINAGNSRISSVSESMFDIRVAISKIINELYI